MTKEGPDSPQSITTPTGVSAADKAQASGVSRLKLGFRNNSQTILAFTAIGAVLISIIGLLQVSSFNLQSSILQAVIATRQASVSETEASHAAKSLEFEALSAYAAQTGVANQDEQAELRAALSATEPPAQETVPPQEATATSESLLKEIAIAEAESAIFEYFGFLNEGQYGEAWSRLTERFQLIHSSGNFASYQGFWSTVDKIAVLEAAGQEIESEATIATLIVRLRFFQGIFDWDRTYDYTLKRESPSDLWKIDNTVLIVG